MSVEQDLQSILSARYGKDVRQSIHDSIRDINAVAVNAEGIAITSSESAKAYSQAANEYEQQAKSLRDEAEEFRDEAFSTTPEGYENVVNKVNDLRLSTEIGNKFIKNNTATGKCLVNKIYGMSEQDGMPSPAAPVEIKDLNVKIRNKGKNLVRFPHDGHPESQYPFTYTIRGITFTFRQDGSIILNGTCSGGEASVNINTPYNYGLSNELVRGRTYYITDGREGENVRHPNGYVQFVLSSADDERFWAKNTVDNKGNTIANLTVLDQIDPKFDRWGVRVSVSDGQTCNNVVVKPMVSFSDDTTYVKGGPNELLETSIVLRALEVESNDAYNFEKDGKYYIADTLEETNDGYEIIRRVGHIVLDGSADEAWSTPDTANDTEHRRKVYTNNDIPSYTNLCVSNWTKGCVISSHYKETIVSADQPANRAQSVALHLTNHWFQFYDERYTENNTTAWRAHLAEEPLVVNYRLYKTVKETVSAEDAKILYNIISEDGSTTLELASDVDGYMEVMIPKSNTSGKSLAAYAQAKLNALKLKEIETALLEIESN